MRWIYKRSSLACRTNFTRICSYCRINTV